MHPMGHMHACMQMSVSRSESFTTSSEAEHVGPDADLIFSPIITFYILKGQRVSWNRTTCSASSQDEDTFQTNMDREVRQS